MHAKIWSTDHESNQLTAQGILLHTKIQSIGPKSNLLTLGRIQLHTKIWSKSQEQSTYTMRHSIAHQDSKYRSWEQEWSICFTSHAVFGTSPVNIAGSTRTCQFHLLGLGTRVVVKDNYHNSPKCEMDSLIKHKLRKQPILMRHVITTLESSQ